MKVVTQVLDELCILSDASTQPSWDLKFNKLCWVAWRVNLSSLIMGGRRLVCYWWRKCARVSIDSTHHSSRPFLTLVDHRPSVISTWWQLRPQTASSVVQQQESVFYECGAHHEILLCNNTAFCNVFERDAEVWMGKEACYLILLWIRPHFICKSNCFCSC